MNSPASTLDTLPQPTAPVEPRAEPAPRKIISIVSPCYNEAGNVAELAQRIRAVFAPLADRYDFEAILVENGSGDGTYEELLRVRAGDSRFKILQLSRNFLMEGGMMAGLAYATGDACVIMAADLQDPPELIPQLIEKWEQGYENVYQIVTKRTDNGIFRRAASAGFYNIINRVSDTPVPRNASDFRLVDRKVYEAFNALPERNRMVRATWGWVGFRSVGVEHERPARHSGESHFKWLGTTGFAIRGILASSATPLRAIPLFGMGLSSLSFVALAAIVVRALFFGVPFPGFGTIVSLSLLLFGFLFLMLGVVSEYVGMIFAEVRQRPAFIVRHLHDGEHDPSLQSLRFGRQQVPSKSTVPPTPIRSVVASPAQPF